MRARLAEPASPIDFARGHGRNSELGRVRRGAPRRCALLQRSPPTLSTHCKPGGRGLQRAYGGAVAGGSTTVAPRHGDSRMTASTKSPAAVQGPISAGFGEPLSASQ